MSDLRLLVGTTKGAFLLDGAPDRAAWRVRGPFCDGWTINHVVGDPATGTIWAGGGGDWSGAGVWRSDDDGGTWSLAKLTTGEVDRWAASDPGFAAMVGWSESPVPFGERFAQVWSLGRVGDRLYAGTKPAHLLVSDDDGETWDVVDALTDHPSAADWSPGAAGLVLHTILADPADPQRLWLGISAAGVFASKDGGATWERRNDRAAPGEGEDAGGEVGHCVHNIVRGEGEPDLLYQQNHNGVWRSDDGGQTWQDITQGLPSTFGFPIWLHPRDPRTVATIPLNGDMAGRYPPDAAAAVWRSRDGGAHVGAAARRAPAGGLLLHGAPAGHGRRPARPCRHLLRHQHGLGLRERRRGGDLGGGRPAPAHRALRRGAAALSANGSHAGHRKLC